MKTRLILIATLLGAGSAVAAQWKPINVTPNRSIYMDMDALARKGTTVQAWDWQKFSTEQTARTWEGKFHWVKSLTNYDCVARTTDPVLKVYFDADGVEVKRMQLEGLQFPSAVEPDSLREKLLKLACDSKDKVVAKAESKPAGGLVPEAAAAEVSKPATKAKPAEPPAKAEDKPKAEEKPGTAAKAEPQKVAMLAKPDEHPAVVPKTAPARTTKPARATRVAIKRTPRASAADCLEPASQGAARGRTQQQAGNEPHWSYLGASGADRWGSLKAEFSACSEGRNQSPIDIQDGARLELEPVGFSYAPAGLRIVDTGHTVQVNFDEGRYIIVGGKRYDLKQFHFHKPAEERIGGRTYDMVAHLVHRSAEGRLAVVAVLFEAGNENAFIRRLWPYLPMEQGNEIVLPDVRVEVDKLLPENRGYYTYMGSLTTPPCTEGVLWIVMKTPVSMSAEQVAVFGRLYPMNARPIQSANGRLIKESL